MDNSFCFQMDKYTIDQRNIVMSFLASKVAQNKQIDFLIDFEKKHVMVKEDLARELLHKLHLSEVSR